MKSSTFVLRAKKALVKSRVIKVFAGAVVMGLAVLFEAATLSSPAQAVKLYAQQNGNIPCSSCHSKKGLADGSMYPFTSLGKYFKQYGQLPPVPKRPAPEPVAPPVTYDPPPPVYNPPPVRRNPPPPVYDPPPVRRNPPPVRRQRSRHVEWCSRKYRSYRARTDTYRGFDSHDHRCISPFKGGGYTAPRRPRNSYNPPPPRYNPPAPRPRGGYNPKPRPGNMSCNDARRIIRGKGYHRIRARKCTGNRYTFYAVRGGQRWRLRIRARTGVIYKATIDR